MSKRSLKGRVARSLMAAASLPDARMSIAQLAREALAEAEITRAPVDLAIVASFQGVRAIEQVAMAQAGRLIPEQAGYRIQVNTSHGARKQRFTIGHEIGHILIPTYRSQPRIIDDFAIGLFDESREEEYLCDVAAAELLLPEHLFRPAASADGCHLNAVVRLADQFDASREATARRLVEMDLWPCALVIWHQAYKKSEAPIALQETFGEEWAPPRPKLRVRYSVHSSSFGHFVAQHLSASPDGPLSRCFNEGGTVAGEETLRIGKQGVGVYVMAAARDFEEGGEPKREILSLLLSDGPPPDPSDSVPTIWTASPMLE